MTIKPPVRRFSAREALKYVGPGLLVTIGFIDPGNWAANIAAGSIYGYKLLWVLTLATFFLVVLQHNAAHLGIATGLCLSEAVTAYFPKMGGRIILGTSVAAAVSTALAEILGSGIALQMLFGIPLRVGSCLAAFFVLIMLATNSYKYLERWLVGFVSLIGLGFLYELFLPRVPWGQAAAGWVTPAFPAGALPIIMSALGAVVMPHNLFLHSEIIQSREWYREDEKTIRHQLKFELFDTLFSMGIGWVINSAMVIVAAATFFSRKIAVNDLAQAQVMLAPLLGRGSQVVFALALLFAGIASAVTAGMSGGTIVAGMSGRAYDLKENVSRVGVGVTILGGLAFIFVLQDAFKGLLLSQMLLSVQLPITIFTLIALTSSKKVMGRFVNALSTKIVLVVVGTVVVGLNVLLILDLTGIL
jgi:manganese transport protein